MFKEHTVNNLGLKSPNELIKVAKNKNYDSKVIALPCERDREKADNADKLLSRFKYLGKMKANKVVQQVRGY